MLASGWWTKESMEREDEIYNSFHEDKLETLIKRLKKQWSMGIINLDDEEIIAIIDYLEELRRIKDDN